MFPVLQYVFERVAAFLAAELGPECADVVLRTLGTSGLINGINVTGPFAPPLPDNFFACAAWGRLRR